MAEAIAVEEERRQSYAKLAVLAQAESESMEQLLHHKRETDARLAQDLAEKQAQLQELTRRLETMKVEERAWEEQVNLAHQVCAKARWVHSPRLLTFPGVVIRAS